VVPLAPCVAAMGFTGKDYLLYKQCQVGKVRANNKTKTDFFQQEFAALHLKEPGEFDDFVK
jgi:hypothetical protein